MKVKVFHIRLTKEHLVPDQDNLNHFLSSVTVKKTSTELLNSHPSFWSILVFYDDQKPEKQEVTSNKISIPAETPLTWEEERIFLALKQWRQAKADELNVPNFMICSNAEFMAIVKLKPQSIEELAKIKGFREGGQKIVKFGNDIITVLSSN